MISPNYRSIVILTVMAITLTLAIAILIQPVSAHRIGQGDPVFLGETDDISLAISWPDFKIAWCAGGAYGCEPPDQIINITGNMHAVYIDPETYHLGTYYRWSGEWNRGEYMVAFEVLPGNRTDINETPEQEPTVIPVPEVTINPTPTKMLIARGDAVTYSYNDGKSYGRGHLWLFGGDARNDFKRLMDLPLKKDGTRYSFDFTQPFSQSMDPGHYTGYLQFNYKNTWQDAIYNRTSDMIDSPYKDVKPVGIGNGVDPAIAKSAFEQVVKNTRYSDDYLIPITLDVVQPVLTFTGKYQTESSMVMEGTTTLSENATVTAIIDPLHWVTRAEIEGNTENVLIEGGIDKPRTFSVEIPIKWDELSIGEHEIRFSVDQQGLYWNQTEYFRASDTYVFPTPTPSTKKIITGEYGWITRTPVPTATVTPIQTTLTAVPSTEIPTTVQPTRVQNITINTSAVTVPTTEGVVVPLNPICGLLALMVAWVVVRR